MLEQLKEKDELDVKTSGNSMTPIIKSGDTVRLRKLNDKDVIKKRDIVFCKVNGRLFIHLVSAIRGDSCKITNNHGHTNGWTNRSNIFAKVEK